MQILLAEEQGRAQARSTAATQALSPREVISPVDVKPMLNRTYLVDRVNFTSSAASNDLFYLRDAAGIVEDIVVRSASKEYTLHLMLDDGQVDLRRTWDELNAMAQDVHGITAAKREGLYTAILSRFAFRQNARLVLIAPRGTTFARVYVKVLHDGR